MWSGSTFIVFSYLSSFICSVSSESECKDYKGRIVENGNPFVPNGNDLCTECLCENGEAQACIASVCSIPHDCRDVRKVSGEQCCKLVCFDRKWRNMNAKYNFTDLRPIPIVPYPEWRDQNMFIPGQYDDVDRAAATRDAYATNYTLRLGFTTMTTFVILVCLVFSVHRLRKRRLRALQALAADRNRRHFDEVDLESESCHHCRSGILEERRDTFTRTEPPPPPYKESTSACDLPPKYEDVIVTEHLVPNENHATHPSATASLPSGNNSTVST